MDCLCGFGLLEVQTEYVNGIVCCAVTSQQILTLSYIVAPQPEVRE